MFSKTNLILLFTSALLLCLCPHTVSAVDNMELGTGGVLLTHFQTNGLSYIRSTDSQKEKVTWVIGGEQATMDHRLYNISGLTLLLDAEYQGKYSVKSPSCQFNQEDQEIHSTSAIQITGDNLDLSGIGYDIYWDDAHRALTIVIRSTAKMVIDDQYLEKNIKKMK